MATRRYKRDFRQLEARRRRGMRMLARGVSQAEVARAVMLAWLEVVEVEEGLLSHAGSTCGIFWSLPERVSKHTRTGMPMRTVAGSQFNTLHMNRMPSSRSTSAST